MGSSGVPREIYIFGIILFYIIFSYVYVTGGNIINENGGSFVDNTENSTFQVPTVSLNPFTEKPDNSRTNTLLGMVVTGFKGYNESESLKWVNYLFGLITALLITMIVILIKSG